MPPKGRKQQLRLLKNQLNKRLLGRKLRVAAQPTPVVYNPWYPLVLVFRGVGPESSTTATITKSSLFTILKTQLGINVSDSNSGFALRIVSFKAWACQPGTSGTFTNLNFGVSVFGFSGSAVDGKHLAPSRVEIEDLSNGVTPARVGYCWPDSDANIVHYSWYEGNIDILEYAVSSPNCPMEFHFHVLWKSGDSNPLPSSSLMLNRIARMSIT